MKNISFKHSGNVGDIIYSIPALKRRCYYLYMEEY